MERRSIKRIQVPGAKVRLKKPAGLGVFNLLSKPSEIIDISKSGLSFQIDEECRYGDTICFRISFPDGRSFSLKGRIRWYNDGSPENPRVGVQFSPFGSGKHYNSIKALEYLRNMDGQQLEIRKKEPEGDTKH
ncbi:MAG TPA: PilZ domain-containing protein [Caldithrix sp.]|nr:PilZ domain-containing protein [Calditrichaceae bacterium]HEM48829.1 PilZ domain-containing protein [Caldithrix sp.]